MPIGEQYRHNDSTTFEELCAGKELRIDNSFFEESRVCKPDAPSA
jgi:hypothetical protein